MSEDSRFQLGWIEEWAFTNPDSLSELGETGSSVGFNLDVQRRDLLPTLGHDPGMIGATLAIARLDELWQGVNDKPLWGNMWASLLDLAVDEWEVGGVNEGPWKKVLDFHFELGEQRGWIEPLLRQFMNKTSKELFELNAAMERGEIKLPTQKKGGCYVATAVYGSYDSPEVWVLRRFRDQVLAPSVAGRGFIKVYYAISPSAVRWLGPSLIHPSRRILDFIVSILQSRGFSDLPYRDLN